MGVSLASRGLAFSRSPYATIPLPQTYSIIKWVTIILYIKQSSNTTFSVYLITIDIYGFYTNFGHLLTNRLISYPLNETGKNGEYETIKHILHNNKQTHNYLTD
jgi:hypothetical protein